jgi:hypothetical protein
MAAASTTLGATRSYELAAGLALGSLSASADLPFVARGGITSEIYFGSLVRARYGWMMGGVHASFGPEIRLNFLPADVVVENVGVPSSVWQLSAFSVGLTLNIATSLYGSLW